MTSDGSSLPGTLLYSSQLLAGFSTATPLFRSLPAPKYLHGVEFSQKVSFCLFACSGALLASYVVCNRTNNNRSLVPRTYDGSTVAVLLMVTNSCLPGSSWEELATSYGFA